MTVIPGRRWGEYQVPSFTGTDTTDANGNGADDALEVTRALDPRRQRVLITKAREALGSQPMFPDTRQWLAESFSSGRCGSTAPCGEDL